MRPPVISVSMLMAPLHMVLSVFLGLSLTALLPAAAWYFVFNVYLFCPYGAKKIHKRLNLLGDQRLSKRAWRSIAAIRENDRGLSRVEPAHDRGAKADC